MNNFKKKKVEEFLNLAFKVKQELETYLSEKAKDDYIYKGVLQLIEEVKVDRYPPKPRDTDIGVAAVKIFDFELVKYLCHMVCKLSELYRKLPDKKTQ